MASFKDSQGNIWDVNLNVGLCKRIKDRLKTDVLDFATADLGNLSNLYANPVLLIDMIYLICEKQCKERNLTDVDFGELFDGDVWMEAQEAFEVALVDFTQRSAPAFAKLLALAKATVTLQVQQTSNALGKLTPAQVIAQTTPGTTSGNAPVSSASTPAPSP